MRIIILVGLGSFIGGISRYLLGSYIQHRFLSSFPAGTLLVNLAGCFLIGLVYGFAQRTSLSDETRIFLTTGLLGGFTTFSSFSYESISLFRDGQSGAALLYIGLSVVLGLLATFAGIVVVR